MKRVKIFLPILLVALMVLFLSCDFADIAPMCGQHSFGEAIIIKEQTCKEEGTKIYTCQDCGYEQAESISLKPHKYDEGIVVQENCAVEGVKTYTCMECGMEKKEIVSPRSHQYDSGIITQQATCSSTGMKTYSCHFCNVKKTETIPMQSHKYDSGTIIKQATCISNGIKTYTCSACGDKKTETISAEHQYDSGKIVKQATCSSSGTKSYACTTCGKTKTVTIAKTAHMLKNYICVWCNEPQLNMTSTEKTNADKVNYISDRQIWHQNDRNRFVFVFCLKDSSEQAIAAPAVVDISITNDAGEEVYSALRVVKASDYGYWTYNNGAKKYQATIYINDSEIDAGSVASGDIYYKVYNSGYFSFKEYSLSIDDNLPHTIPTFKAGETWKVDGQWELSVSSAIEHKQCSSYLTEYHGFSNEQIVMLNFKYKNIGYGNTFAPKVSSFSIVDENGEKGRLYSSSDSYVNGCSHAVEPSSSANAVAVKMDLPFALYNKSAFATILVEIKDSNGTVRKAQFVIDITPESEETEEEKLNGCIITCKTALPTYISYYKYDNEIQSTAYVSEVDFKVSGDDLHIYFTGRKTYDSRGSGQSDSCKIGWKLYNVDNYVIASGTAYTLSLSEGEGFLKTEDTAYNCITPGETYFLVIMNVN